MVTEELGSWEPLPVADAVALFRPAPFRWWLSGGHALEAHINDSWRHHDDTDIGIVRSHAPLLPSILRGWEIHVAAAGILTPWCGGSLATDRSENNLWCRPSATSPWMLDITVGDGTDEEWIYRRDTTVRRDWADAILTTTDGTPYLAPELQMLFKSKAVRPKDNLDAATVLPRLNTARRAWLQGQLPTDHPWHRYTKQDNGT